MVLITLIEYIISKKPKKSRLECLVPGCSKFWILSGPSQGFMRHAAQSHAFAHWERYHEEQKHPKAIWRDLLGKERESVDFCGDCKNVSQNEFQKRVAFVAVIIHSALDRRRVGEPEK